MPSLPRRIGTLALTLIALATFLAYNAGARTRTSVPAVLTTTTVSDSWSPSPGDARSDFRGMECGGKGCYGWTVLLEPLPSATVTAARLITFEADLDVPPGSALDWSAAGASPVCELYFYSESRVPQEGATWIENTNAIPVIPQDDESFGAIFIEPGSSATTIHAGGAGMAIPASRELTLRVTVVMGCYESDNYSQTFDTTSTQPFVVKNIAYSVTTFGK